MVYPREHARDDSSSHETRVSVAVPTVSCKFSSPPAQHPHGGRAGIPDRFKVNSVDFLIYILRHGSMIPKQFQLKGIWNSWLFYAWSHDAIVSGFAEARYICFPIFFGNVPRLMCFVQTPALISPIHFVSYISLVFNFTIHVFFKNWQNNDNCERPVKKF